jgi:hypothetical protein
MAVVERVSGCSSLIDVLDRALDKGIVIDARVPVSLIGMDLITVEARMVVVSIDTYLKYADAVGQIPVSRPRLATGREPVPMTVASKRRVSRTPLGRVAHRVR